MGKEVVVHIHNGILFSYKRNPFESVLMRWMNLEPITQSEIYQEEKDKYCLSVHIYGILKDGIHDPIYRAAKETQTKRTAFSCVC